MKSTFAKYKNVDENKEMVLNQNKQIRHHTEELDKVARKSKNVPAWVVGKVERSATDISDATHFLDGAEDQYAKGGTITQNKWDKYGFERDGDTGFSERFKGATNKSGHVATGEIIFDNGEMGDGEFIYIDESGDTYQSKEVPVHRIDMSGAPHYGKGYAKGGSLKKDRLTNDDWATIKDRITNYGGVSRNDFYIDKEDKKIWTYTTRAQARIRQALEGLHYYSFTESVDESRKPSYVVYFHMSKKDIELPSYDMNKDYIVYTIDLGHRNGYNEDRNDFVWMDEDNATRYTEEEAKNKRKELLKPSIEEYQKSGKGYQEIYSGKARSKNDTYAKGGKTPKSKIVYSSDNVYGLEVIVDGELVEEKIIRANRKSDAREIAEDDYEPKFRKKYGDNVTFNLVDKYAKGGMTEAEKEQKAAAIKTAVEIASAAYDNGIKASDMSFEQFADKIARATQISYGIVDLRLAYEAMKNKGYAEGGEIEKKDSLLNHVTNEMSSGYLGSRLYDLGYTDGLQYKVIDRVRPVMSKMLRENGDQKYSIKSLNDLIAAAASQELGKSSGESSYAKGGAVSFNKFFDKFKSENAYIGEPVKNAYGEKVFEVRAYDDDTRNKMTSFLKENDMKYRVSVLDDRMFQIVLDKNKSSYAKGGVTSEFYFNFKDFSLNELSEYCIKVSKIGGDRGDIRVGYVAIGTDSYEKRDYDWYKDKSLASKRMTITNNYGQAEIFRGEENMYLKLDVYENNSNDGIKYTIMIISKDNLDSLKKISNELIQQFESGGSVKRAGNSPFVMYANFEDGSHPKHEKMFKKGQPDDNKYAKGGEAIDDSKFDYMMLDRLRSDNDYFLGNGNRHGKNLWAGSVDAQISEMKKIWNRLPVKPEWLSMEDILEYEREMKEENAKPRYAKGGGVEGDFEVINSRGIPTVFIDGKRVLQTGVWDGDTLFMNHFNKFNNLKQYHYTAKSGDSYTIFYGQGIEDVIRSIPDDNKYAKGGETEEEAEVIVGGYPYYLKKIDYTHLSVSNTKGGRTIPQHVAQFRSHDDDTFYRDVEKWLKGELDIDGRSYKKFYEKGGEAEQSDDITLPEGGEYKKWYGGTAANGGIALIGKRGLDKIKAISKKYPKNLYVVTDDNYHYIGAFWLQNGKFAKQEAIGNPSYDLAKNVVTLKPKEDIIYKFMRANEKSIYAEGGHIGFKVLEKEVAKEYEGQQVPKKYRKEYGSTYSAEEADEVGKKVAGKVKAEISKRESTFDKYK